MEMNLLHDRPIYHYQCMNTTENLTTPKYAHEQPTNVSNSIDPNTHHKPSCDVCPESLFLEGFQDCADEVLRFLTHDEQINTHSSFLTGLRSHLTTARTRFVSSSSNGDFFARDKCDTQEKNSDTFCSTPKSKNSVFPDFVSSPITDQRSSFKTKRRLSNEFNKSEEESSVQNYSVPVTPKRRRLDSVVSSQLNSHDSGFLDQSSFDFSDENSEDDISEIANEVFVPEIDKMCDKSNEKRNTDYDLDQLGRNESHIDCASLSFQSKNNCLNTRSSDISLSLQNSSCFALYKPEGDLNSEKFEVRPLKSMCLDTLLASKNTNKRACTNQETNWNLSSHSSLSTLKFDCKQYAPSTSSVLDLFKRDNREDPTLISGLSTCLSHGDARIKSLAEELVSLLCEEEENSENEWDNESGIDMLDD